MNNDRNNLMKKAVALSYDETVSSAPRVTAKGSGKVAESILEIAKENKIPVQEDTTLVELLGQLEINETIPEELYRVVAEIFAFVYKVDKSVSKS